jgi:hypothetical protein
LINFDAYTTHALDHLTRVGAWAIYVIKPSASSMLVKIGKCTDPPRNMEQMQRRSPTPLELHRYCGVAAGRSRSTLTRCCG